MKTGILWDLDGTLLDTLGDLRDATNHVLADYGLPQRSAEEIRRFVGNGARQLIALALPGTPQDPPVEEVLAAFQCYYKDHCRILTRPYPGILEVLDALADRYPMAVVSNKPDAAVKVLAKEYFPRLYARGESSDCPRKPAPDMVNKTMAALGVDRCIYVGDSEVDVLTAKNAGVPCLSVLWGFRTREEIEPYGGTWFCHRQQELPEIIERMEKEIWIHGQ